MLCYNQMPATLSANQIVLNNLPAIEMSVLLLNCKLSYLIRKFI